MRSMAQNRDPRNEPTLIKSINLNSGLQGYTVEKDNIFNTLIGKTEQLHAKKIKLLFHNKNTLEMD